MTCYFYTQNRSSERNVVLLLIFNRNSSFVSPYNLFSFRSLFTLRQKVQYTLLLSMNTYNLLPLTISLFKTLFIVIQYIIISFTYFLYKDPFSNLVLS